MTTRILEKHEEIELARAWLNQGCERSRARLVTAYQPMIKNIARKHMRAGLNRDDLIQEGNIGFLAGLDNFDPDKGFSVGTLASYHIRSRMQLHIAEFLGILRLPNSRRIKGLISQCVGQIKARETEVGRTLTDHEKADLCKEAGFSLAELHEYEQTIRPVKSLSAPSFDDEAVFEIRDETAGTEALVEGQSVNQAKSILADILAEMPERTRTIITLRHLSEEFVSLESIAEQVGISRERVRRIELDALQKIKTSLAQGGIKSLSDVL
jgi:RNA polymerase sigma-32 factor